MAPTKDAPPPQPTDVPGISSALRDTQDVEKQAALLGALFSLDAIQLTKDAAAVNTLVAQVKLLMSHADMGVRGGAVKVVARLLSMGTPHRTSLESQDTAQALWRVLEEFSAVFDAYLEGARQLSAAVGTETRKESASGAKKTAKGAVPLVGPTGEAALPGPSKQVLDAALRGLTLLATPAPAPLPLASALSTPQPPSGLSVQPPGNPPPLSCTPLSVQLPGQPPIMTLAPGAIPVCFAWLVAPGASSIGQLVPLLQLLQHHSVRIQAQAAMLTSLLGEAARQQLLSVEAVPKLMQAATSSISAAVRLNSIQALMLLLAEVGPGHAQAVAWVDQLLLLAAQPQEMLVMPQHSQGLDVVPLDFARPVLTSPADLQTRTLQLLAMLSHNSQAVSEQLAAGGALQSLLSLLPSPLLPPPPPRSMTPEIPQGASPAAPMRVAPADVAPGAVGDVVKNLPEMEVAGERRLVEDEGLLLAQLPQDVSMWVGVISQLPRGPPPAPLASAEAQSLALLLVQHLLSIPDLQAALAFRHNHPGPPPVELPPDEGAGELSAQPVSLSRISVCPPLEQLLYVCTASASDQPMVASLAVTPEPTGAKGKVPDKKPKGKEALPAEPLVSTAAPHLFPPFSAAVRAAAMCALSQLARHTATGQRLADDPHVQSLIAGMDVFERQPPPARAATPPLAPTPPQKSPRPPLAGATPLSAKARPTSSLATDTAPSTVDGPIDAAMPAPRSSLLLVAALASLMLQLVPYTTSTITTTINATAQAMPSPAPNSSSATPPSHLTTRELVEAAKQMAKVLSIETDTSKETGNALAAANLAVAALVLALPVQPFVVAPRPPLDSPPGTPPPMPLATSAYLWDALDRPQMTDGTVRLAHI